VFAVGGGKFGADFPESPQLLVDVYFVLSLPRLKLALFLSLLAPIK
jgi:hypothetical protein